MVNGGRRASLPKVRRAIRLRRRVSDYRRKQANNLVVFLMFLMGYAPLPLSIAMSTTPHPLLNNARMAKIRTLPGKRSTRAEGESRGWKGGSG
jgi:hypothetical protein